MMKKTLMTSLLLFSIDTNSMAATPILPTGDPLFFSNLKSASFDALSFEDLDDTITDPSALPSDSQLVESLDKIASTIEKLLRYSATPKKLEGSPQKIPHISHSIWLPRDPSSFIGPKTFEILKEKLSILSNDPLPWTHIFWTTRSFDGLEKLQALPLEVKFIDDEAFQSLPTVKRLLAHDYIGAAVDLLRYDIMRRFGGFYSDLNYRIWKSPLPLFQAAFISSLENYSLENYMMAASPGHKVFETVVPLLITLLREESLNTYPSMRPTNMTELEELDRQIQLSTNLLQEAYRKLHVEHTFINEKTTLLSDLYQRRATVSEQGNHDKRSSFLADVITTTIFGQTTSDILLESEKDTYYLLMQNTPTSDEPTQGNFCPQPNQSDRFLEDKGPLFLKVCSAFLFGEDSAEESQSWLSSSSSLSAPRVSQKPRTMHDLYPGP